MPRRRHRRKSWFFATLLSTLFLALICFILSRAQWAQKSNLENLLILAGASPALGTLTIRLAMNLFTQVHVKGERGGKVASFMGLVFGLIGICVFMIAESDLSVALMVIGGGIITLSVFLLIVGDVMINWSDYNM